MQRAKTMTALPSDGKYVEINGEGFMFCQPETKRAGMERLVPDQMLEFEISVDSTGRRVMHVRLDGQDQSRPAPESENVGNVTTMNTKGRDIVVRDWEGLVLGCLMPALTREEAEEIRRQQVADPVRYTTAEVLARLRAMESQ